MSYYLEEGRPPSDEYKNVLGEVRKLTLTKMIDYAIDSEKFDELLKDVIREMVREKLGDVSVSDGTLLADSGAGFALDEAKLGKIVSDSVSSSMPGGGSLASLDDKVGQTVASVDELTSKLSDLEASIGRVGNTEELAVVKKGMDSVLVKLDNILEDLEKTKEGMQAASGAKDTGMIKKGIGALLLKLDKVLEDGKVTEDEMKGLKETLSLTKKSAEVKVASKLDKIHSSTKTSVDRLKNINTTSYKVLNRSAILEEKILKLGEAVETLNKSTAVLTKSLKEVPGAEELKADLAARVNSIKAGFKSLPYMVSKIKALSEEMYNVKDMVDDTSRASLEKYNVIMDNVYELNKNVSKIGELEERIKRINQKTFQLTESSGAFDKKLTKLGLLITDLKKVESQSASQLVGEFKGVSTELVSSQDKRLDAMKKSLHESIDKTKGELSELILKKTDESVMEGLKNELNVLSLKLATSVKAVNDAAKRQTAPPVAVKGLDAINGKLTGIMTSVNALKKQPAPPASPVTVKGLDALDGKLDGIVSSVNALKKQPAPPALPVTVKGLEALEGRLADIKGIVASSAIFDKSTATRVVDGIAAIRTALESIPQQSNVEVLSRINALKGSLGRQQFNLSKLKDISTRVYQMKDHIDKADLRNEKRYARISKNMGVITREVRRDNLFRDRVKDINVNAYRLLRTVDTASARVLRLEEQLAKLSRKTGAGTTRVVTDLKEVSDELGGIKTALRGVVGAIEESGKVPASQHRKLMASVHKLDRKITSLKAFESRMKDTNASTHKLMNKVSNLEGDLKRIELTLTVINKKVSKVTEIFNKIGERV